MSRARTMHNPAVTVERYLNLYEKVLEKFHEKKSFQTGTLHETEIPVAPSATRSRAFIVDPSAVGKADSSHHAEHVLAFSAMLEASHITPHLIINKNATLENPYGDTKRSLSWTIYDKIRVERDVRDGPAVNAEEIAEFDQSSTKSFEIYATLKSLHKEYSFARRDAILFPTTDRFCIEGVLLYLYSACDHQTPSFHMNIMFEKAEFLLGRYPLAELMRAARESGYLRKKLFLYAETKQMASDLSVLLQEPVGHLVPPHLFQKKQLKSLEKSSGNKTVVGKQAQKAYAIAEEKFGKSRDRSSIEIPKGKNVIVSLGRGRRDKGWNILPDIVAEFNKTPHGDDTVFIFQRPREMDNLQDEESRIESYSNVILLDEIVETELLNNISAKADVFLLPYSAGVYRNRGSAFGWRAVLQEKPLVVSEGTALVEALLPNNGVPGIPGNEDSDAGAENRRFQFFTRRKSSPEHALKPRSAELYCNGKVAKTATEFATALADVLTGKEFFAAGARAKLLKYYQACVLDNPIKNQVLKDNFSGERHTLIIHADNNSAELPDQAFLGYHLGLCYSQADKSETHLMPLIGRMGEAPVNAYTRLDKGALDPDSFPEFIRDALNNSRIDTIYAPYDLAVNGGRLRNFPEKWMDFVVLY